MTGSRRSTGIACIFAGAALLGCGRGRPPEPAKPPQPAARPSETPATVEATPAITLTPKAAAVVKDLVAEQETSEKIHLRLRVSPGGCQGYLYDLDLERNVSAEDSTCESEGVSVVASRRQVEMLRGTRIDYGEENGQQGFKIDSPNFKGEAAEKWLAILQGEKKETD